MAEIDAGWQPTEHILQRVVNGVPDHSAPTLVTFQTEPRENLRSAVSLGGILISGVQLEFYFRTSYPTGSPVDYRMTMPRLFAFYLPRVLVPDRHKIEDMVKKAIQ